ncbi:hypothetical protein [Diplocloster agilis]|uniref:L-arabinose isomerase family protein n=1 Tax=Diplocloster agilis TaxID=2850323 RepID=UPI0008233BDA|nr:hypothetical protein [Suonthocola fibrivorans]MCU6733297.1 hypothetical protein [Suonthocola fibrivorans]SCI86235.1 L-arabinose isomerase [uncultured Clostridium sp.]
MMQAKLKPRIGLLRTGHRIYWSQFPNLKDMGSRMYTKFRERLEEFGEVVDSELVDSPEAAVRAAEALNTAKVDILLIFPLGYTTGMMIVPAVRTLDVPIRLINAHEDSSYDYKSADTEIYLHHEGPCCIPEYAGTLVGLSKKFKVISGHFQDEGMWDDIRRDCMGAAAGSAFEGMNFAVIGNTYTNMTDMPTDEQRVIRTTGRMLCRPEIEEFKEAYERVTDEQLQDMYEQFRSLYEVDETVTNEHMKTSAQIAVAYDKVIRRHKIDAFGYYWWGATEETTTLRSQSALAVSRLAAMGIPGVTEGDIKTAMAMKLLDLLGGGGMFLEFFSMDFDEDFIMVGHDGPSNINVASGRPRLKHLDVQHGKTGKGLGIDFDMKKGPCTLINLTQFGTDAPFKLIYTIGEVVEGDILNIGNPNCRVRVAKPIPQFFDEWCQAGPSHHLALGVGDFSREVECFAQCRGFECVRI